MHRRRGVRAESGCAGKGEIGPVLMRRGREILPLVSIRATDFELLLEVEGPARCSLPSDEEVLIESIEDCDSGESVRAGGSGTTKLSDAVAAMVSSGAGVSVSALEVVEMVEMVLTEDVVATESADGKDINDGLSSSRAG